MSVDLLLVDDHAVVRKGLVALIGEQDGFNIVGEAENGRDAIALCRKLKPDIVVMDISMPEMNGIEATREIKELLPETRVLALSMHAQKTRVEAMLEAGASGYLIKSSIYEEIISAIQTVSKGEVYISEKLKNLLLNAYVDNMHSPNDKSIKLSNRERQVLQLVAEGLQTKEIGVRLAISPRTVEMYRRRLNQKLDVDSVAELTKYAIREGLTTLDS